MPREPVDHGRIVYVVPPDFPERLELLQKESGLPWAEIARRLGTYPLTIRRWLAGVRPKLRHQMALLDLADELGTRPPADRVDPPGRNAAREAGQRRPARVRETWEESRASARRPPPQGLNATRAARMAMGCAREGHRRRGRALNRRRGSAAAHTLASSLRPRLPLPPVISGKKKAAHMGSRGRPSPQRQRPPP